MTRLRTCLALVAVLAVAAVAPSTAEKMNLDLGELLGGLGMEGFGGTDGGGGGAGSYGSVGGMGIPICDPGELPAPTENPEYKFECNGCGPKGMQVKESFGLYKCCNGHDLCYSTCGTSKDFCERVFKACMAKTCDAHAERAECKKQADSMTGMTGLFGGSFHARTQKGSPENGRLGACDCYAPADADRRWEEKFTEFYEKHSDPPMTLDEAGDKAKKVLSTYKPEQRGEVYYKMIKKYQKSTKETEFVWDNVKAEL